jgi:hypothetical protein
LLHSAVRPDNLYGALQPGMMSGFFIVNCSIDIIVDFYIVISHIACVLIFPWAILYWKLIGRDYSKVGTVFDGSHCRDTFYRRGRSMQANSD